ncbi:MAG: hypothetical protein HC860_27425 [Alkalinema sp. RU_4_3]|nr:hypothetical protein [Alkalinema sp. RU_4_3]
MSQPPFDVAVAHRWFAVEFNNRAWDLVEKTDRTADEAVEIAVGDEGDGGDVF